MGRQKGQSQRTKGNVRPSSSSRAASLLGENQRFVGFDSMSGNLGYVPMLKSLEDDKEAEIDADFRVSMNKMTKKDVTTKTKALTEFSELCKNKPVHESIAILAYWPRIYNKLCDDSDRKVREFGQIAFINLIEAVKKEIAPHLKSIMGCWWMAQSDTHAPTSSAAKKAFSTAFPTVEKQKKALLFCQEEILQGINCTIFAQYSASIDSNDPGGQERKQSMALMAFAAFLRVFDSKDVNKVSADCLEGICLNSRFWKIAKAKSSVIRAAFYSAIAAFCSQIPHIVASQLSTMAKCVMYKLDESNPLVSKSAWEAANNLITSFDDWHEQIDIRKGFLPQLWSLIKKGFYGNAKIVGPCLPKLVSCFPSSLTVLPVYDELFKCLDICLQSDKVLKSPIEVKSVVAVTISCMDVVFQQMLALSHIDSNDIINLIWTEHLFVMVKSSLLSQNQSFVTSFHNTVANYFRRWSEKAYESQIKDRYGKVCASVWNDISDLGKEVITKSPDFDDSKNNFLGYLKLLIAIHRVERSSKNETKTIASKNVKFVESTSNKVSENLNSDDCATSNLNPSVLQLHNNLKQCVKDCIQCVLQCDQDKLLKAFVLHKLLQEFSCVSLFELLSPKNADCASVFLEESILPLVRTMKSSDSKDHCFNMAGVIYCTVTTCQNSVSDIFEKFFSEFSNSGKNQICLLVAQNIIDDNRAYVTSECEWFLKFLMQVVDNLGRVDTELDAERWKVLQFAFSTVAVLKANGALVILQSLNKFLKLNASVVNVIEINKIYALCFSAYSDCETVMNAEKANFSPALFKLLDLLCDVSQENLIESLRNTISALLRTCYESESTLAMEFVANLCCQCATYASELLFKHPSAMSTSNQFQQVAAVFAEEVVMHHAKQNFIVEWLSALLPDPEQWHTLRPSFDSKVWNECSTLMNEFENKNVGEIVKDNYFSVVQTYANVAAEIAVIFSEAYSKLTLHLKYRSLIIEILFAKAISGPISEIEFNLSLFQPELYAEILVQLFSNAITVGSGWLIAFAQFANSVTSKQWDDDLFMTSIFQDDPPLSFSLAQVLTIFIEKSASLSHLMTIMQWSFKKFMANHLAFVENVEGSELTADALTILISSLRKVSHVQGNKLIKLDGDESPLPVHAQLFEKMVEWKSSNVALFLFDADLLQATPKQLDFNSAMIRFLHCVVDIYSFTISSEQWDFIQCSFVSWMESCSSLKDVETTPHPAALKFLACVCNIMLSLERFITSPIALSDPTIPSSLNNEWSEFFKPAAHSSLIVIHKAFSESKSAQYQRMLPTIGKCLCSVTSPTLISCSSSYETHLRPGSSLPNEIQTLLHHFSAYLLPTNAAEITPNQTIAFTLLNKLLDQVFKDNRSPESPDHFLMVLDKVVPEVRSYIDLLEASEVSETIPVPSKKNVNNDDDYLNGEEGIAPKVEEQEKTTETLSPVSENSYFYSFLLVWKLIINLINSCPSEKKSEYIAILVESPIIDINELFSIVTFVLPASPYFVTGTDASKVSMFTEELKLHEQLTDAVKMEHLICTLYKDLLRAFPVDIRLWFNSLSKNDRANITDYTSRHVTQVICREELDSISKCKPPPGLSVQVRKVAREVVATYEISDTNFEIAVQLPANYPLSPVQVNTIQRVGVASSQWRYWMLQMTMLLQRQNGNILDAFLLWKQKVDKKLDGLEECMICFSIVHGTNTRSLPKLQCKTCRKKYHPECLYKWFDTSNQSTCPLCRSPMMFK